MKVVLLALSSRYIHLSPAPYYLAAELEGYDSVVLDHSVNEKKEEVLRAIIAESPDVLGLSVLLVGIFLTTFKKTNESYNRKWLIYSALFFVCAAGVGLTFKAFSKSASPEMAGDMMLFSSIVMLISYTIICLFTGGFKSEKEKNINKDSKDEQKLFIIYALCSGFLSCVYNRLNIFLAGELPGVVFYPSFNGGVVFLSMTLSILLLREKLSRKQIVGIAIGIIGICIIGVF